MSRAAMSSTGPSLCKQHERRGEKRWRATKGRWCATKESLFFSRCSYLRLDDDEHLDPLLLHASPPPACRLLFEPFPQPDCIDSSELL